MLAVKLSSDEHGNQGDLYKCRGNVVSAKDDNKVGNVYDWCEFYLANGPT